MGTVLKQIIRKLDWFFTAQLGICPHKVLYSLWRLSCYIRDYFRVCFTYKGCFELKPCLHDRYEEGGITKSEYFWQDLLVAGMIFKAKPERHVDVGSRLDGFITHVASFREIEVFDVRPVTTVIHGVIFNKRI